MLVGLAIMIVSEAATLAGLRHSLYFTN